MMHELEQFVVENFPNLVFDMQVVQYPLFLSTKHLPIEYKEMIQKTCRYPLLVNYMMQPGENFFGHFINYHNKLNELRNEDFTNLNPMLSDYIDSYKDVPSWEESKQFFIDSIAMLKSM